MMTSNIVTLKEILKDAEKGGYAAGSFSPRYTRLIKPILKAIKDNNSPAIIQISQKELNVYGITPKEFADEFYRCVDEINMENHIVLHLDHTKDFNIIKDAIAAGFKSVMIDASEKELQENIKITRAVVQYAAGFGVSVEAELGKIGTTDFAETDRDEEMYTIPEEAKKFVDETGVEALAVSVGTAHGIYNVRKPKVDYDRLEAIGKLTNVHLVLHGGSGVPAEMIEKAIKLKIGAISKVNIATDIEQAFLKGMGRAEKMTNKECNELPSELYELGAKSVYCEVESKIRNFVMSYNQDKKRN